MGFKLLKVRRVYAANDLRVGKQSFEFKTYEVSKSKQGLFCFLMLVGVVNSHWPLGVIRLIHFISNHTLSFYFFLAFWIIFRS